MPGIGIVDALEIVKDIEFGRGRIGRLMSKRPELAELCRHALSARHGPEVSLYRAVYPINGLLAERVVSTTPHLDVALSIASDFPVLLASSGTVAPAPVILHYRVENPDVLAYVPELYRLAAERLGEGRRFRNRYGSLTEVAALKDVVERECEVIADVSSAPCRKLAFVRGGFHKEVTPIVARNPEVTPEEFLADYNAGNSMKLLPTCLPDIGDAISEAREFLTHPSDPHTVPTESRWSSGMEVTQGSVPRL